MGLDTIHLRDLLIIHASLEQSHMGKQGQYHRCCRGCCHAFVPWNLLVMRAAGQTDLSLDHVVDQQAQHGQHGQGRNAFGLLQPHGTDRGGVLHPAQARFSRGILIVIGLKNVGIRTDLRVDRCGQHRPPRVLFRIGEGLDLSLEPIARRRRGRVRLRWPSPPSTARAAGVCDEVIADGVIPPRV
jgi:hypothetical protein